MHLCRFLSKLIRIRRPPLLCRYFFQDAVSPPGSLSTSKSRTNLMRSNRFVKMSSVRTKSSVIAENNKLSERNTMERKDGNNRNNEDRESSSSSSSMPLTSLVDDAAVSLDNLTTEEKSIYRLHKEACKAGQVSYTDPATGYVVLTQRYHIARGKCCGSCCRHCPYSHVNVPEKYRTKKFNSAFFV